MKRLLVISTIISGLAMPAALNGQNSSVAPDRPEVDPARVARASEVGHREFVDPGNEQATIFAQARGIPVAAATSELKRQAALGIFIERLKTRHPDKFSFVSIEGDQIVVGLTDPSIDLQSMLPPGLANVKPVQAVYSEEGTYAKLDDLRRQLAAAGIRNVDVGVNAASGRIEFLTKYSRAALEVALKAGAIAIDHGHVILDDDIVTTASLDAGLAYNVDQSVCVKRCELTTGFSLISTTTSARYTSTAAHGDNGRARYSTNLNSTYSSGGISLGAPTEMTGLKLDIQYAAPSSSTNYPNPYFWNGSSYVAVTDWTYPTSNVQFCKFGRMTGNTCGIHSEASTIYSNEQWTYLRKITNNGTGSKFVIEGDSGGPVYYGNWALGWVHGRNANYDLFYTPVNDFKRLQGGIDLIVYK